MLEKIRYSDHVQLASAGIRINSVSSGIVRTLMTPDYAEKDVEESRRKLQYYGGMPPMCTLRELGGNYVYLLSLEPSYTTGIGIAISGMVGAW